MQTFCLAFCSIPHILYATKYFSISTNRLIDYLIVKNLKNYKKIGHKIVNVKFEGLEGQSFVLFMW